MRGAKRAHGALHTSVAVDTGNVTDRKDLLLSLNAHTIHSRF